MSGKLVSVWVLGFRDGFGIILVEAFAEAAVGVVGHQAFPFGRIVDHRSVDAVESEDPEKRDLAAPVGAEYDGLVATRTDEHFVAELDPHERGDVGHVVGMGGVVGGVDVGGSDGLGTCYWCI